jgi:hypothetical protein
MDSSGFRFSYFTPAGSVENVKFKITTEKITSNDIAFKPGILKTTDKPPYLRGAHS